MKYIFNFYSFTGPNHYNVCNSYKPDPDIQALFGEQGTYTSPIRALYEKQISRQSSNMRVALNDEDIGDASSNADTASEISGEDLEKIRHYITNFCKKHSLLGTILLAKEGINGAISGHKSDLYELYILLLTLGYKDFNLKLRPCAVKPFERLKVKIKPEIVKIGLKMENILHNRGKYIKPTDWDSHISSEDAIVIDTRNDYEYEEGTFAGAVNPKIKTFQDLPKWLDENMQLLANKKIYMFCTGGIRCEKSTAYLASQGFKDVFHLEGGILEYLDQTKNINNKWQGGCLVFDDRKSVDEKDF